MLYQKICASRFFATIIVVRLQLNATYRLPWRKNGARERVTRALACFRTRFAFKGSARSYFEYSPLRNASAAKRIKSQPPHSYTFNSITAMKVLRLAACIVGIALSQSTVFDEDTGLRGEALSEEFFLKIKLPPALNADPHGGLTRDSPEVLHEIARKLREEAKALKRKVLNSDRAKKTLIGSPQDRLFQMALDAIRNPMVQKYQTWAVQWEKWWGETHPPIVHDERLVADRFLAYVVMRFEDALPDTDAIVEFENTLDEMYIAARSAEQARTRTCLEWTESYVTGPTGVQLPNFEPTTVRATYTTCYARTDL